MNLSMRIKKTVKNTIFGQQMTFGRTISVQLLEESCIALTSVADPDPLSTKRPHVIQIFLL